MIKVRHSMEQHWVALELSATITPTDIKRATERIQPILKKMEHGYTLIEVFRGSSHLEAAGVENIGNLTHACYKSCRIWRVVRIYKDNGRDPGMVVTHRIRWKRHVPEIELDNFPAAVALAEEEIVENNEWL